MKQKKEDPLHDDPYFKKILRQDDCFVDFITRTTNEDKRFLVLSAERPKRTGGFKSINLLLDRRSFLSAIAGAMDNNEICPHDILELRAKTGRAA